MFAVGVSLTKAMVTNLNMLHFKNNIYEKQAKV